MLDYIIDDFERFRILNEDNSVGAMVVCDSGEQAVTMNNIFLNKFKNTNLKKSDIKTFQQFFRRM